MVGRPCCVGVAPPPLPVFSEGGGGGEGGGREVDEAATFADVGVSVWEEWQALQERG